MQRTICRAIALTGSDQAVMAHRGLYAGFTIRETAGATATVRIYDNASAASGTLLETIQLGPNESAADWYEGGIQADSGIYVDVVSGAVEGSVRIG